MTAARWLGYGLTRGDASSWAVILAGLRAGVLGRCMLVRWLDWGRVCAGLSLTN